MQPPPESSSRHHSVSLLCNMHKDNILTRQTEPHAPRGAHYSLTSPPPSPRMPSIPKAPRLGTIPLPKGWTSLILYPHYPKRPLREVFYLYNLAEKHLENRTPFLDRRANPSWITSIVLVSLTTIPNITKVSDSLHVPSCCHVESRFSILIFLRGHRIYMSSSPLPAFVDMSRGQSFSRLTRLLTIRTLGQMILSPRNFVLFIVSLSIPPLFYSYISSVMYGRADTK